MKAVLRAAKAGAFRAEALIAGRNADAIVYVWYRTEKKWELDSNWESGEENNMKGSTKAPKTVFTGKYLKRLVGTGSGLT